MSAARADAVVAAVDLGATSGRVMLGHVGRNHLSIQQVARFTNGPASLPNGLHWNIQGLYRNTLEGLREAAKSVPELRSIGIDSWAVDYALLRGGRILGEPFHYRDERNNAGVEHVHEKVAFADLYARNGLQFLPFNTLYQLATEDRALLNQSERMLLIPDLLAFWLTGQMVAERTNASTTGLLDISTGEWDTDLMQKLGLAPTLFAPLVNPGETIGSLREPVRDHTGLSGAATVTAVGSHDTASAVVAAPMHETGGAYISCGTWGLVGVETEAPVLTAQARDANFTNERGVDGRTRFLHNVMGLWLLSESIRSWERAGTKTELTQLLDQAAAVGSNVPIFDANDPVFLPPGNMPERITQWMHNRDIRPPNSPPQFARSIIESLAHAFAAAVHKASALSGQEVNAIHIIGGGSQIPLLCQRTADIAKTPVIAGPVEATSIGNVLVQGRALGILGGTLESMRALVRSEFTPQTYNPSGD